MLTEWLTEGEEAVFGLVAIGGMGKSSVAWVWAKRDVAGEQMAGLAEDAPEVAQACRVAEEARPEGVLWWSFYEGGGTFQGFLEAAITYCSGAERSLSDYVREDPSGGTVTDYGRMREDVLHMLRQGRFLVIWDGAERLLREYGGLDAEIREERDPEELEPEDRDCLDRGVERFLQEMCGQSRSRMLLATRLFPRGLDDLAGARPKKLEGLGEQDAVAYLQALGIHGTPGELAAAAREYDFHPLSLTNLAADLREDFEEEGDIRAAPRYDETESLKARQHHILERAYQRRAPHRRELLSRMAAMHGAIPKEVVRLLAEDIEGLDMAELGRHLAELRRHGLLRHPSPDTYSFHPVVRRYCYERLSSKQETHEKLIGYFVELLALAPRSGQAERVEDLAPVIELYHHTVRAGRYDEAWGLFRDRLADPLYYQFGAYQTCIELLGALFPDGEEGPPGLRDDGTRASALSHLANSYKLSGNSRRAMALETMHNELWEGIGATRDVAMGLVNLEVDQTQLGQLRDAERSLRRASELFCALGDEWGTAVVHCRLARLHMHKGARGPAAAELEGVLAGLSDGDEFWLGGHAWCERALQGLLVGEPRLGLSDARAAGDLWEKLAAAAFPPERDGVQVEWLLGWALVALAEEEREERPGEAEEHLVEAEDHLTDALTRCRRINNVELEPDILLAWARWHRVKGNREEARRNAEEALYIADRCEYRLKQAEVRNFLAQMALEEGDRERARGEAEIAKERAWCDGPPHCYKPALEEAERLLGEIG